MQVLAGVGTCVIEAQKAINRTVAVEVEFHFNLRFRVELGNAQRGQNVEGDAL